MNFFKKITIGAALTLGVVSAFFYARQSSDAKSLAKKEIAPFLKKLEKIQNNKKRKPAQAVNEKFLISVNQNYRRYPLREYDGLFSQGELLNDEDILLLSQHVKNEVERLGLKDRRTNLSFVNQFVLRNKVFIRLQQTYQTSFLGESYKVPIEGAQVILKIENEELSEVKSSLVNFSITDALYTKTGLEFEFSDREFQVFLNLIKINPLPKRLMRIYTNPLLSRLNAGVDFETLLNRVPEEQRASLNLVFQRIGRISLLEIFKDLAQAEKLSLVQQGSSWMYQVNNFFELPVQFDIQLGEATDPTLKVRNLRMLQHSFSQISGFESPLYPAGSKTENTKSALRAKEKLQMVVNYIYEKFGWKGYRNKNEASNIKVHTQLRAVNFRENAAWVGSIEKILVGEDGETLENLDSSLSVLGHEYVHALIQFSSGLLYRGQSGAVNEHVADIIGAAIEAFNNEGRFLYTIGEDVLRPDTKIKKKELLDLIFENLTYDKDQEKAFRLRTIGMRHLYAPELSYSSQLHHMVDVEKSFSENCIPSYDNDNCGVHTSSGVLNRALALAMSVEGVDKIVPMVFNTAIFRLRENSSFQDYLFELYDECKDQIDSLETCNNILASFAAVGLNHPDFQVYQQIKNEEESDKSEKDSFVDRGQSVSPPLRLCGWVDQIDPQNYRIFDNKYNALLVNRNFTVKTQGDYSLLDRVDCACVSGRLTQRSNLNGDLQNIFISADRLEDRTGKCSEDPQINQIRPRSRLRFRDILGDVRNIPRRFCGWVSVNSRSRNVTIIDNRFDAAILASGYRGLTEGTYRTVYNQECACVTGVLMETVNSVGTVFNAFSRVINVKPRPYDACIGLEWR